MTSVGGVDRILIFAPNWLGDAVMALPALADVRRAHPDAHVAVAARASVAPLFALVPEVDETIVLGGAGVARVAGVARGFSRAILFPNSFHAALVAWRAGIPERWGYRGDWRRLLLTRAVEKPAGVHQVAYFQHLVSALGYANGPSAPRIELAADTIERAVRLLESRGWNGREPLVAIAPGAAYGGAKRWPAERYGELARRLGDEGIRTVMIGSAADEATARDVERVAGGGLIDLVGRTTLAELAGVLGRCRAAVSNDSGAMHLAAAIGARLIAIFGPTREHETAPVGHTRVDLAAGGRRRSAGDRTIVLVNTVPCRPCMLRECPIDHPCMRGISVDAVRDAVSAHLTAWAGQPTAFTQH